MKPAVAPLDVAALELASVKEWHRHTLAASRPYRSFQKGATSKVSSGPPLVSPFISVCGVYSTAYGHRSLTRRTSGRGHPAAPLSAIVVR